MDLRKYNIYFHTHTISGIIIAALLYVIFFAGSFSFFKDDITAWQKGKSAVAHEIKPDYNFLIDSLGQKYNLRGRDFDFYLLKQGHGTYVNMSVSKDTTISKPKKEEPGQGRGRGRGRRGGDEDSAYFLYHFTDKKTSTYADGYDMGEFLYRLHFLAQLNQVPIKVGTPFGYLVAGIVSFLFLFALITGLFLHWEKIKSNFFLFRPWSKWKTVWTDMHTALGVIGFPYQFIFAVTGVVLIVNWVMITPMSKFTYNGEQDKLYEDLQFSRTVNVDYAYNPAMENFDLNAFLAGWQKKWGNNPISRIHIRNYLDQNMQILIESKANPSENFAGSGMARVEVVTGKVLHEKSPKTDTNYIDRVKSLIYHLHFGDFGGKPLRIVYFIMGLMGCLVIISGIVIWLVARDKNNTPSHKRIFNFWASNVFLAACLSMLPVTAFTFAMVKILPHVDQTIIYRLYFYAWLFLGFYLLALRNLAKMNKHTLILSILLCLAVPVANGYGSGNWMWKTFQERAYDIFFIDILFLSLAIFCGVGLVKVQKDGKPFKIIGRK